MTQTVSLDYLWWKEWKANMAEIDVPHCLYWAKLLKTSAIFSADYENNALLGHNPKEIQTQV